MRKAVCQYIDYFCNLPFLPCIIHGHKQPKGDKEELNCHPLSNEGVLLSVSTSNEVLEIIQPQIQN